MLVIRGCLTAYALVLKLGGRQQFVCESMAYKSVGRIRFRQTAVASSVETLGLQRTVAARNTRQLCIACGVQRQVEL